MVPVSPGELIDKITILNLKVDRIADPEKQKNVYIELEKLEAVREQTVSYSQKLQSLARSLHTVNARLWEIEDEIRDCERASDFGKRFIALARAVYVENDKRAALKREINLALGSDLIEEKCYSDY